MTTTATLPGTSSSVSVPTEAELLAQLLNGAWPGAVGFYLALTEADSERLQKYESLLIRIARLDDLVADRHRPHGGPAWLCRDAVCQVSSVELAWSNWPDDDLQPLVEAHREGGFAQHGTDFAICSDDLCRAAVASLADVQAHGRTSRNINSSIILAVQNEREKAVREATRL